MNRVDKNRSGILHAIVATLLLTGCSSAIDDEWEQYQVSVIRLVSDYSTGTAFAVNEQGYYVTNQHVIADAGIDDLVAIESTAPAVKVHPAEVMWSDADKDLAIVHVPSWTNKPLPFLSSEKVKVNLPVLSIGFPGSNDAMSGEDNPAWTVPTLKRGIVSETISIPTDGEVSSWDLFEHSAIVNSGNSGGPLVDECGRVVGINVAKASTNVDIAKALEGAQYGYSLATIDTVEGAYFAIHADEAMAALTANKVDFSQATGVCLGEKLGPETFVIGLLFIALLFSLGLFALFLYVRKMAPERQFNLATVSEVIIKPPVKEEVSQEKSPTGPAVYRGEGGEVVVCHAMRLVSVTGQSVSADLLPGSSVRIGRDMNQCDIVFINDAVSRQHAEVSLSRDGQDVRVVDLKSTQGTYIDGIQVSDEKPGAGLKPDQRLIIGSEDAVLMLMPPDTQS